uniref:Novel STAND NTPase 3 domain-containing protein n=1 Tax=Magallana gigas TaxID=29159 RepID=A0A8W8IKB6_MAGGI
MTQVLAKESRIEKAIFDQWKQDEVCFILTKACEEVEKLFKSRSLVIVAGHSGSGKSAIIQHIALKYREQGWTVKREKQEILNKYTSDMNLSDKDRLKIVKVERTCNSAERGNTRVQKKDKGKYCALALLVLFNDDLCLSDLKHKDTENKFKRTLKLCGLPENTPPLDIGDILNSMKDFYVKKVEETYTFYHDFVMEVTNHVFGTDYPLEIVECADIGFIKRRVKIGNFDKHDDSFTIYLNDKYIENLGERLFTELFGERLIDVVLNPCLRNEKLVTILKTETITIENQVQNEEIELYNFY